MNPPIELREYIDAEPEPGLIIKLEMEPGQDVTFEILDVRLPPCPNPGVHKLFLLGTSKRTIRLPCTGGSESFESLLGRLRYRGQIIVTEKYRLPRTPENEHYCGKFVRFEKPTS